MIKHSRMTWEPGHMQFPFTFCFVRYPGCMSHLMMDCYWVYPNLGFGGSHTTWFMMGSYGHIVTWCSMVREVFLPSSFKVICFSCCSLPVPLCFLGLHDVCDHFSKRTHYLKQVCCFGVNLPFKHARRGHDLFLLLSSRNYLQNDSYRFKNESNVMFS